MNVLIAGDFCDRLRVGRCIADRDFATLFDDVKQVVTDADYSIVNFEFPIVKTEGNPIPKCGPNLCGSMGAVEAVKYAGFKVCTLANNHILDQGAACCIETKKLLEDAGLRTVGAGTDKSEAEDILFCRQGKETLAIINCCEHEFSIATEHSAGANPLNPVSQYYKIQEAKGKADHVLVIVHGGHEHFQLPSLRMKETYRFFIDAGADAVVNHHQHCYSGYEVYKGKPIFYGLGNFLFDSPAQGYSTWNEGFMVKLHFCENEIKYELFPYKQCCEKPSVELMKGEDKSLFFKRVARLNHIIANPDQLKAELDAYYEQGKIYELSLLEPYRGRVLKKLYSMGILPSFLRGKSRYAILNHVACEAHRDKLVHALISSGRKA